MKLKRYKDYFNYLFTYYYKKLKKLLYNKTNVNEAYVPK